MQLQSATIFFLLCFVSGVLNCAQLQAQTVSARIDKTFVEQTAVISKNLNLFDKSRNRTVPVALYSPSAGDARGSKKSKLKLAVLNHGYGMKNSEYSFIAETLVAQGYLVASIQHEIAGDEPLPTNGKPSEVRRPFWERNVQNILFVIEEIKRLKPGIDAKNLLLVGHSNGGDTAALFAEKYPKRVRKIITLDNRRMALPRVKKPQILSIRSSDQVADAGVLPTAVEQRKFGIKIVEFADIIHNDMWDGATDAQKRAMSEVISDFIQRRKTSKIK